MITTPNGNANPWNWNRRTMQMCKLAHSKLVLLGAEVSELVLISPRPGVAADGTLWNILSILIGFPGRFLWFPWLIANCFLNFDTPVEPNTATWFLIMPSLDCSMYLNILSRMWLVNLSNLYGDVCAALRTWKCMPYQRHGHIMSCSYLVHACSFSDVRVKWQRLSKP